MGGVRYEGETLFRLSPRGDVSENDLVSLVEGVLQTDSYTFGDWFDLPVPMYLVRDREHDTTFRVVVRYGSVELHILPDTLSSGLRAIYRRLSGSTNYSWNVTCESRPDS